MADDDEQRWGPGAPLANETPSIPPPPGAPPAIDLSPVPGTTVVSRRGKGRLVLAGVLAVAMVAGVAALVTRSAADADPDAALAAAQAVAAESESYRYELLEVSRVSTGDPDGAGSDTTTRSLTKGAVAADDRWRTVEDFGDEFMEEQAGAEMIRVGDTLYGLGLGLSGDLGPSWIAVPIDEAAMGIDDALGMYGDLAAIEDDSDDGVELDDGYEDSYEDEYRLDAVMLAYLFEVHGQPSSVRGLIARTSDPAVEEQLGNGGVRLRGTLTPEPAVVEAIGEDVPAVDILLDLDPNDHPVLAKFTARWGSASAEVEITFSDWGAPVIVDAPSDDEIDLTPWVSEEALAALPPDQLIAPREVPGDLDLVMATTYSGEDFGMSDGCASLELQYSTESSLFGEMTEEDLSDEELEAAFADMDYLSISVTSDRCADEFGAGLAEDFMDGFASVTLGDAQVQISSSLDEAEMDALTASLGSVTVEELVASIPAWVAETPYGGAFGGGFLGF